MSDTWWASLNNWSSSILNFTSPPFLVILGIDSNIWPIRKWNQTKRLKFGPLSVFNTPFIAHSGLFRLHLSMRIKLYGVCHGAYGHHYWEFIQNNFRKKFISLTSSGHELVNSGFMFWKTTENDWLDFIRLVRHWF